MTCCTPGQRRAAGERIAPAPLGAPAERRRARASTPGTRPSAASTLRRASASRTSGLSVPGRSSTRHRAAVDAHVASPCRASRCRAGSPGRAPRGARRARRSRRRGPPWRATASGAAARKATRDVLDIGAGILIESGRVRRARRAAPPRPRRCRAIPPAVRTTSRASRSGCAAELDVARAAPAGDRRAPDRRRRQARAPARRPARLPRPAGGRARAPRRRHRGRGRARADPLRHAAARRHHRRRRDAARPAVGARSASASPTRWSPATSSSAAPSRSAPASRPRSSAGPPRRASASPRARSCRAASAATRR